MMTRKPYGYHVGSVDLSMVDNGVRFSRRPMAIAVLRRTCPRLSTLFWLVRLRQARVIMAGGRDCYGQWRIEVCAIVLRVFAGASLKQDVHMENKDRGL